MFGAHVPQPISLQTLELTALQARILSAITPEKIEKASLSEIVKAFWILKKAERGIKKEPFKIVGLVGHLIELERQKSVNLDD